MLSDHRLAFSKQVGNMNAFFAGELGFDVLDGLRERLQTEEDTERLQELLSTKS
jgi:hypothetical protein